MFAFLPKGHGISGRHSPWSVALAVVLIVPIVIITLALIPAIAVCPFASSRHQRIVERLLVGLRQWTQVISLALTGDDPTYARSRRSAPSPSKRI